MELFTGPTVQSRHHLQTVSTTAEETSFWEPWTWRSVTSDILEKTFTYLLTYLPFLGNGCILHLGVLPIPTVITKTRFRFYLQNVTLTFSFTYLGSPTLETLYHG